MTAFQRTLTNTERWNETVVTPPLAKPHELICTPNIIKVNHNTTRVEMFNIPQLSRGVEPPEFSCSNRSETPSTSLESHKKKISPSYVTATKNSDPLELVAVSQMGGRTFK